MPRFTNTSSPLKQESRIHPVVLSRFPELFFYPVDLRPCIKENAFDDHGLILYIDNGVQKFHPTLAAIYAIVCFENYMRDDDKNALDAFNRHIQYIEEHIKYSEDKKAIYVPFEFDFFDEKAPWTSGITTGFIISAFARKYLISKEEKYKDYLLKSFEFMSRPIGNLSGSLYSDTQMEIWYEEDTHGYHILNGNVFSVFSLYELTRCLHDESLNKTLDIALRSIAKNLYRYDLGFYSRYDLSKGSICNTSYHRLHINVLSALHDINPNSVFNSYAHKFDNYTKSIFSKTILLFYLYFKTILAKFRIII